MLLVSAPAALAADKASLRAGAAVTDITPDLGVSLDGLLMRAGPIRKVLDPLQVRCLVLDNGETRLAMVVCDACVISDQLIGKAKKIVHEKTGLPPSHILVSATHTHMAPRLAGWSEADKNPINRRYYALVADRIAEAVGKAIENLAPAKIGWGTCRIDKYLANRRWIMKPGTIPRNPFGQRTDRAVMGNPPKDDRLERAGPVDPEMTVLSVRHADGNPLCLMANYGVHYGTYQPGVASADYFGLFCRQVEESFGSEAEKAKPPPVGIMSNGASADVAKARGDHAEMARRLATEAVRISETTKHRSDIALFVEEVDLALAVRKPDGQRLAWAREVLASSKGRKGRMGKSQIYAEEALRLNEFPETLPVKLQAMRIGEAGMIAIPGEVFAESGLALKEDSPLRVTMTVSHANGWHGYLPPPRQHKLGGMEVWPRRASYLEVGATSKIHEALLHLLQQCNQPDAGQ